MFDTGGLTPAMLGRLNKHLDRLVRYDGRTMTRGELYALPEFVAKAVRLGGGERFTLVDGDECLVDVPKMVFDSIRLPLHADLHQTHRHGADRHV